MNKITNKFKKLISFLVFLLAYLQNFITWYTDRFYPKSIHHE